MPADIEGKRPNFLMIMVDQLRFPRFGYGQAGLLDPIKDILSLVGVVTDNLVSNRSPSPHRPVISTCCRRCSGWPGLATTAARPSAGGWR